MADPAFLGAIGAFGLQAAQSMGVDPSGPRTSRILAGLSALAGRPGQQVEATPIAPLVQPAPAAPVGLMGWVRARPLMAAALAGLVLVVGWLIVRR